MTLQEILKRVLNRGGVAETPVSITDSVLHNKAIVYGVLYKEGITSYYFTGALIRC